MFTYCTINKSNTEPVETYVMILIIPKILIDFPNCKPFIITFLTYS